jgi:hypothetical protein
MRGWVCGAIARLVSLAASLQRAKHVSASCAIAIEANEKWHAQARTHNANMQIRLGELIFNRRS